jgi:hypothetical protein
VIKESHFEKDWRGGPKVGLRLPEKISGALGNLSISKVSEHPVSECEPADEEPEFSDDSESIDADESVSTDDTPDSTHDDSENGEGETCLVIISTKDRVLVTRMSMIHVHIARTGDGRKLRLTSSCIGSRKHLIFHR